MAGDIASLGLEIDSRPVANASKDLDRLSTAAQKAERSSTGLMASQEKLLAVVGRIDKTLLGIANANQKVTKSNDEAAEAAKRATDAYRRVVSQIEFERAQLARNSDQKAVHNNLRRAGVTAASAEGRAIEKATLALRGEEAALERTTRAAKQADAANDNLTRSGDRLSGTVLRLRSLFISLGVVIAARFAFKAADDYQLLENRLKALTGSVEGAKREMGLLFDVAQRTRSDFGATAETFARLALVTQSTGLSIDQTRKLVEGLNAGMINVGTSNQEAAGALRQLGQAFASGKLAGDELRSVLENLGPLGLQIANTLGFHGATAIGDFSAAARGGELSIAQIAAAIHNALLPEIDRLEDSLPTVGQAFTQLRNELERATAEAFNGQGASAALVETLGELQDTVTSDAFQSGLMFIADVFATIALAVANSVKELGNFIEAAKNFEVGGALNAFAARDPLANWLINAARGSSGAASSGAVGFAMGPGGGPWGSGYQGLPGYIAGLPSAGGGGGSMGSASGGNIPIPGVSGPTEEQIKAAEKAAKAYEKARKDALEDIAKLEADAAAAALEGIAALEHARDVAVEEQMGRYREGLIHLDEFAAARLAIEEKFQKEKNKIEEDAAERVRKDMERDAQKEADKRQREAEREAERQAELMQRPFLNALDNIQDSFTDFFEKLYSGGVDSFKDLADSAKKIFTRLAAELTTLKLFGASGIAGLIGGTGTASAQLGTGGSGAFNFGSLLSGGGGLNLNSFLTPSQAGVLEMSAAGGRAGGVGTPGVGGGFFGSAGFDLGGFLGGAGLGFGAGSLLNSLVGGNSTGGSVGSGIGGLAGAAIGSIIPGIGTLLGGLGGGALGGLLGGLFGGGKSVGPNSFGRIRVDSNGQLIAAGSGADNGGNAAQAGQLAEAVAQQVNAILDSLGAGFTSKPLSYVGSYGGQLGVRSGAYDRGRFEQYFGNDPAALVEGATLQAFAQGNLSGVSKELGSAIRTAAKIADDLEDFSAYIGVASAILDESLFDTEELTAAEEALKNLNEQFSEAAKRAKALGLSVATLEQLRDQAIADLTEGFEEGIAQQILALTDPVAAALANQAKVAEERLKEAEVLGASLVEVERLNALERQKILEQSGSDLNRFFEEITFGSLSGASPGASVEAQRAAFEAAAAQGNQAEISRIGRGLLDSARGAYASGPQYQQILGRVQEVVGGYVAGNGFDNLLAAQGEVANLNAQSLNVLTAIYEEMAALRQENARLASLIEARSA